VAAQCWTSADSVLLSIASYHLVHVSAISLNQKVAGYSAAALTYALILLHELVEVQLGCEAVLVSFAKAKRGPKEVLYLLCVFSRCLIPFSIGVRLLEELCRLRTSLCLQFKPHHIAAGAIFLAAKFLKVKLPSDGDKVWWQEFGVTPRQLEGWFSFLQPSPFKR
jgi:hypothetical protein